MTADCPRIWRLYIPLLVLFFLSPAAVRPELSPHNDLFTQEERQLVRSLFLRRFGLDDLTEMKTPPKKEMPDYIWQLYEQAQDLDQDILRHFWPFQKTKNTVSFRLDIKDADFVDDLVEHADLRIQLSEKRIRGQLTVLDSSGKSLDSKRVPQLFSRSDWVDLDVTKGISNKNKQVEFSIHFQPEKGFLDWSEPAQTAALVTFIRQRSNQRVRRKREAKTQRKHRKHRKHHVLGPRDNTQCKRTKLYVDFSELNWDDWIMAPAGYDAYQCQGRCTHPLPSQLNTTNHAIIQSLIHSIDPSAVPPPSCVPTENSAISILYRDINNTVVVKTYADMKVEACGCH